MKPRGASSVCYESFFYAAETGKPDDISHEVEEYFSTHIEDPLSKEIPVIIDKIENYQQIFDNEKYTLAIFMSTMWLRNPSMRIQINDMQEKALKWINKIRYSHPNIDDELDKFEKAEGYPLSAEERDDLKLMMINEEYDLEFSNQSHLEFMLNAEHMRGFTNLFYGQHWVVHISKCERQFVTSDNPVTTVAPRREEFYGPTFLERTHFFPLTPNVTIEAVYPRNEHGKKLIRKTHFGRDEHVIDTINLHMAGQAEYLYASRPDEIEWFKHSISPSFTTYLRRPKTERPFLIRACR